MTSEDEEFGVGGPLELNEANVVAVQDQLKVDPPALLCPSHRVPTEQAEIDSLKKWLNECGQQVHPTLPTVSCRPAEHSQNSGRASSIPQTLSTRFSSLVSSLLYF